MICYENLHLANRPFLEELRHAFETVLASGCFILGEETAQFEKEFALSTGTRFCTGVSSGSSALLLALEALHLPAHSEVLVAANAHVSDVLAIVQNGLTPVLVDPDPHTYNMSLQGIQTKLTAKTSAILTVHLYGKLCPMDTIIPFAEERGLKVIEDCAQAHGATLFGKQAGSFGTISAFSFYPTKNLGGMGDGGAIVTNDEELNNEVRLLRNYGAPRKNEHELLGYNQRLDELQAAFLRVKLKYLPTINAHKRHLASLYLQGLQQVILPTLEQGYEDAWHIFPIRHEHRNALQQHLACSGIETLIHYPIPLHRQKAFIPFFPTPYLPVAETLAQTVLSLPSSFMHTEQQIYQVIDAIHLFFKQHHA